MLISYVPQIHAQVIEYIVLSPFCVAVTEYHRLGNLYGIYVYLVHGLEAEKLKI